MRESERGKALGDWGEAKAIDLLRRAGFEDVADLNQHSTNHPFADLIASKDGKRFIVGVKTRNKHGQNGKLNPSYNLRAKGRDLSHLAERFQADLAWVTIQVDVPRQTFCAYFGTADQLNIRGERYSIPMLPKDTADYGRLALDERDEAIKPEWKASRLVASSTKLNRERKSSRLSERCITIEFLDAFADAWNRHDTEGILAAMTDDCIFQASLGPDVTGTNFVGHDETRNGIEAVFQQYPDARWNGPTHFIAGDRGVTEWVFTGTRADGSRVEVQGCDLFTFREGKIAVKNSYRKQRV